MTFATFLPSRVGARSGQLPASPGEPLHRAATHRPAGGAPRGAHVREAAFGLSADRCGGGGPRVRGADGSVVEPAGDARLRSRPERTRASAGDAAAPRDTPAHAGLRRLR